MHTNRVVIKAPVGAPTRLPKRNEKCICGSGKKAKRCCLLLYEQKRAAGVAEAQARLDATGSLKPIKTLPPPEAGGQSVEAGANDNDLRQSQLPEVRGSQSEAGAVAP